MNKPISAINDLLRGARADSGEAILSFAILFPILLGLSLAILEFSLVILDYNRASEATRRAARIAAIQAPIGDLQNVAAGDITCSANSGTTFCNGGTVLSAATFDAVVQAMQIVLPAIAPENVQVVYGNSGIGDTESGGIKPFVSVNLINLQRPFMFLHVIAGVPAQITFPSFSTTQMIGGFTPP